MKEITFILDEAEAKGYSDNIEKTPGEFGVMAGYLIPNEYLNFCRNDLELICESFFSSGKVHITSLPPGRQQELRSKIFDYFIQKNIYWLYEAIFVQGYFESADSLYRIVNNIHKEREESNIRISMNEKRGLLHSELFTGAFSKAIAFCLCRFGKQFKLNVITDRVDDSIIKLFKAEADDFLSIGKEKIQKITGFDKDTSKILRGSVSTSIPNVDTICDLSGISYSIDCEDSSLTLAADVLVNSVSFHLKKLQADNLGFPLNNKDSISSHPLSGLAYGAWDSKKGHWFSDVSYKHPMNITKDNEP